ncbi:DUF6146 family protein [Ichthyenterobacterium magnum]|uniref:Lipoprotein n=1 Tax=Ichthyenterobacterium magnum TaxID=1230530 RepID=A0A420DM03_9FLAO|nr:DUF6146 family protein [Ichthyenterobacterium magnum]RKE95273.1 hypothetical protein BXY80_1460 [Ichthyenterobacterium magnum]
MKTLLYMLLALTVLVSCNTTQDVVSNSSSETINEEDTIKITSDETEYEIIIMEPGFGYWLKSTAKPEGYYSQQYLETRNRLLVNEWNLRATQPNLYNPDMYLFPIDYNSTTDYGYDVNYKLYNYFVYFQLKNKIRLSNFIPRI